MPVKLTDPTDPTKTYTAAIIDNRLACTLYGGEDVLDPSLTDTKRMLLLKAFKGPITTLVSTSRIGYNTFITELPALKPLQQQQEVPEEHWFRWYAWLSTENIYADVELRLIKTKNPTLNMNGNHTPVCPVEITWKGYNDTYPQKHITAIFRDAVFDKLPYSGKLGCPLSQASIPQILTLVETVSDIICRVDISVATHYGKTCITRLDVKKTGRQSCNKKRPVHGYRMLNGTGC